MQIDNETWLQLEDGRLISLHKQVADQLVAEGKAEHIPHERVVYNDAGTSFALLDKPARGKAKAEPKAKPEPKAKADKPATKTDDKPAGKTAVVKPAATDEDEPNADKLEMDKPARAHGPVLTSAVVPPETR